VTIVAGQNATPQTILQELLVYAYELPTYRILDAPSWVTADRYTVLGKTSGPATPPAMRVLMQQSVI
jgi:uncharacterized protein (TIGR03435 family)